MVDEPVSPAPAPAPSHAARLTPEAQAELSAMMTDLANDKEMRPAVGKWLKKKYGKTLPDVELDDIRQTVTREFEDRDLAEQSRRSKEKLESDRAGLITGGRFTEDDVKEIEKIMEKHGISDYTVASKVYAADQKPADPRPEINSRNFELPKFDKTALADPKAFARNKANEVVGELMRNRSNKRAHA